MDYLTILQNIKEELKESYVHISMTERLPYINQELQLKCEDNHIYLTSMYTRRIGCSECERIYKNFNDIYNRIKLTIEDYQQNLNYRNDIKNIENVTVGEYCMDLYEYCKHECKITYKDKTVIKRIMRASEISNLLYSVNHRVSDLKCIKNYVPKNIKYPLINDEIDYKDKKEQFIVMEKDKQKYIDLESRESKRIIENELFSYMTIYSTPDELYFEMYYKVHNLYYLTHNNLYYYCIEFHTFADLIFGLEIFFEENENNIEIYLEYDGQFRNKISIYQKTRPL